MKDDILTKEKETMKIYELNILYKFFKSQKNDKTHAKNHFDIDFFFIILDFFEYMKKNIENDEISYYLDIFIINSFFFLNNEIKI